MNYLSTILLLLSLLLRISAAPAVDELSTHLDNSLAEANQTIAILEARLRISEDKLKLAEDKLKIAVTKLEKYEKATGVGVSSTKAESGKETISISSEKEKNSNNNTTISKPHHSISPELLKFYSVDGEAITNQKYTNSTKVVLTADGNHKYTTSLDQTDGNTKKIIVIKTPEGKVLSSEVVYERIVMDRIIETDEKNEPAVGNGNESKVSEPSITVDSNVETSTDIKKDETGEEKVNSSEVNNTDLKPKEEKPKVEVDHNSIAKEEGSIITDLEKPPALPDHIEKENHSGGEDRVAIQIAH